MSPSAESPTAEPPTAGPRGTRPGLLVGLTEPNLPSAAIALAVVAAGAAALFLGVDEVVAARRLAWIDGDGTRAAVRTTSTLVGLRTEPSPRPLLLVLGSSAVRNSIDVPLLTDELAQRRGEAPDVRGLCSGSQPLVVSHGIVENLPRQARGIVLLGVGVRQFADTPQHLRELGRRPRLGVRADVIDDAIRSAGGTPPSSTGHLYAWDNRAFLLPRLLRNLPRNLLHGVAPHVAMPQRGRQPYSAERLARVLRTAHERLLPYEREADGNERRLASLASDVQRRPGLTLALFESPLHPELARRPDVARMRADLRRRLRRIAAEHDAALLSATDAAHLSARDFLDATHLRDPDASRRVTRAIGSALGDRFGSR